SVYCFSPHRPLYSLPTRRSSDLGHFADRVQGLGFIAAAAIQNEFLGGEDFLALAHAHKGADLQQHEILAGQPIIEGGGKLLNVRSEEHTSELQSRFDLVCRLLLE